MPVAVVVEDGDRLIFGRGQYEKVACLIAIHRDYRRTVAVIVIGLENIAHVLVENAVAVAEEIMRGIVGVEEYRRVAAAPGMSEIFKTLTAYLRAKTVGGDSLVIGGGEGGKRIFGHGCGCCAVVCRSVVKIERIHLAPRPKILKIVRMDVNFKKFASLRSAYLVGIQRDALHRLAEEAKRRHFHLCNVHKHHSIAGGGNNHAAVAIHVAHRARRQRRRFDMRDAPTADINAAVGISQRPETASLIGTRRGERRRRKPGSPCEGVNLAVTIDSERAVRTAAKNSAAIPVPRLHVAERRPQSPLRGGGKGCQKKEG